MSKPIVYFEHAYEGHEEDCYWKGCRFDVCVQIDQSYYSLNFNQKLGIRSGVRFMFSKGRYHRTQNNLILVEDVTTNQIIDTVAKLHEHHYFDHVKEVDVTGLELTVAVRNCFLEELNEKIQKMEKPGSV